MLADERTVCGLDVSAYAAMFVCAAGLIGPVRFLKIYCPDYAAFL